VPLVSFAGTGRQHWLSRVTCGAAPKLVVPTGLGGDLAGSRRQRGADVKKRPLSYHKI